MNEERGIKTKKSNNESFDLEIVNDYEIDFHSRLPYGLGYDDKVKQPMAQSLRILKYKNEKAMDELVEKLGYMDYRDALACNRYILEAKQSKDYHQQARAKALAFAFSKLTQLQR